MGQKTYPIQVLVTMLPQRAAALLKLLRAGRPRIHAITNAAAQVFTANLLLAAGAVPSLTIAAEEISSFTSSACALLANLGTLDGERRRALPLAIAVARKHRLPWILDPVFADASPARRDMALELLAEKPTVMRCNASEFRALSGESALGATAVAAYAGRHELVVALTGATDIASDGERIVCVHNGHPLMQLTTAMGCAGTALVAAFCALSEDRLEATAAALLVIGIAGEIAAARAGGPGSYPAHFLDALHNLDAETIEKMARLS